MIRKLASLFGFAAASSAPSAVLEISQDRERAEPRSWKPSEFRRGAANSSIPAPPSYYNPPSQRQKRKSARRLNQFAK
jgi:hypothetical protein